MQNWGPIRYYREIGGEMTASERRVLLSNLVGEANEKALNNDEMWVDCFVRTGYLLEYERLNRLV